MDNDSRRERFYREFAVDAAENLTANSILDILYRKGILTSEEIGDIMDLSTPARRRQFWMQMQTKDYQCIPVLIEAIEAATWRGQLEMVGRMKEYVRNIDPPNRRDQNMSDEDFPCRPPNLVYNFVERPIALVALEAMVTADRGVNSSYTTMAGLYGLGGIGKTSLTRRYIDIFRDKFPGALIFWLESETRLNLQSAFQQLCRHVGIGEGTGTQAEAIQKFYKKMANESCLFVFDNVSEWDGADGVVDFVPSGSPYPQHYLLATTRKRDLVQPNKMLRLDVMLPGEAQELVQKTLYGSSEDSRMRLCRTLGCLPLALQQAIAYIRNSCDVYTSETLAIDGYLQELNENACKILQSDVLNQDGRQGEKTVYLTWQTTLAKIAKQDIGWLAHGLLRCMSYISPDNIQLNFFTSIELGFGFGDFLSSEFRYMVNQLDVPWFLEGIQEGIGKPPKVHRGWESESGIKKAAILLNRYSMITLQNGVMSVHRLVQEVVRHHSNSILTNERMFVERILSYIDRSLDHNDTLEQCIQHGVAIASWFRKYSHCYAGLPKLKSNVFEIEPWLSLIMQEVSDASTIDAFHLLRGIQDLGVYTNEQLIRRSSRFIKLAMKSRNALQKYIEVCAEVKRNHSSDRDLETVHWDITSLELQGTLSSYIMTLVPLFKQCTTCWENKMASMDFISRLLSISLLLVREAIAKLEPYEVIELQDDKIIIAAAPCHIPVRVDDNHVLLQFLEARVVAGEFDGECFAWATDLLKRRSSAFTHIGSTCAVSEKLVLILEKLPSVGRVKWRIPNCNHTDALLLEFTFGIEPEAVDIALQFILKFRNRSAVMPYYIRECNASGFGLRLTEGNMQTRARKINSSVAKTILSDCLPTIEDKFRNFVTLGIFGSQSWAATRNELTKEDLEVCREEANTSMNYWARRGYSME